MLTKYSGTPRKFAEAKNPSQHMTSVACGCWSLVLHRGCVGTPTLEVFSGADLGGPDRNDVRSWHIYEAPEPLAGMCSWHVENAPKVVPEANFLKLRGPSNRTRV